MFFVKTLLRPEFYLSQTLRRKQQGRT